MSDGTLYALMGMFPVLLLVGAVEARGIRERELSGTLHVVSACAALLATLASGAGLLMTLLSVMLIDSGHADLGSGSSILWAFAIASVIGASTLGVILHLQWARAMQAELDRRQQRTKR